jgi:4-O-beta-D-mannosyl-D-glucose phosphorylase
MAKRAFHQKPRRLEHEREKLLKRPNRKWKQDNGIFDCHEFAVLTAEHTPRERRQEFNYASNSHLVTHPGINSVFNVGAMEWNNIVLAARVRKSFFAIAESRTGVDRFCFWNYPARMPRLDEKETDFCDMRLVRDEDGWNYGLFCAERHDGAKPGELSAAIARFGTTCGTRPGTAGARRSAWNNAGRSLRGFCKYSVAGPKPARFRVWPRG